ncbi:MAG: response regulator, partial [Desulfopila sp.]|jgi:DNA-binding NtrC family response regulator|nr:response regulator [Desulfopila sp.]
MTRKMLEKQGYFVLAASGPTEALHLAQQQQGKIHLLLSDVVMPEMNGKDLAGVLRSICPGLKCLFMSGYTSNVIAHHGVLEQGVHFIQKPFSREKLADKVEEALGRA